MSTRGFRLRHLAFHGIAKEPAIVEFGSGLNVIYGASETGKSFVVEAIDFMLGGGQELRDIGERIGYDRVFLGVETIEGEQFTLERSAEGGSFRSYQGLFKDLPPAGTPSVELAEQHNEKNDANLSMFLLARCGLAGKRVRKNSRGETNSLSFRHLARLLIVNENEITAQHSPLSDGNPITETPNLATFKLLLTGVDDSSLISSRPKTPEDQSRFAQVEMLEKMLGDYGDRLKALTKDPGDVPDQLQRLDAALSSRTGQLRVTESEYRSLSDRRREARKKLEMGKERREEVDGLLQRFTLLERHYVSDVQRLKGIEEGGTLFEVLGKAACPLCGALPEHHRAEECGGDASAVVAAARSEIAKIAVLRAELVGTIDELRKEARRFDRRLPQLEEDLRTVGTEIETTVAPRLTQLRASYSELADKKGQVREAASLLETIADIEGRRAHLERQESAEQGSLVSSGDLPSIVADDFSKTVEAILKEWHFPEAERIHFDPKKRDLVIAGKLRTARGKGLRAITHSAFTIALLEYCRTNTKPHPGFVVLDSPLLAYREPESEEDKELAGTDLAEQFYNYLAGRPSDRQIIIVENRDPPAAVRQSAQVTMFSKNPGSGRYGLFPRGADSS
jgi:hypothetical protein